jgi:hypothetical protein
VPQEEGTENAKSKARHWWFTPVILVTWEAEIGRFKVSLGK